MNNFLIPANSKKSALILGLFKPVDLIIIGIGVVITFILLLSLPIEQMLYTIIALTPALVAAFLVFPIAYYHNVRTFIAIAFDFITSRQKFIWKGWCMQDEYKDERK
jgi:hypothetical protein